MRGRWLSLGFAGALAAAGVAHGQEPGVEAGVEPPEALVLPDVDGAPDAVTVAPGVVLPGLANLSATRQRPLFSQGRRPPVPPPEVAEAEPPAAPPAPVEPPPFDLAGVVVGGDVGFAILRNTGTQAIQRARQGETFDGWTVSEISQRFVVLTQDDRSVRLSLFEVRPGEAAKRPPPPSRIGEESEDGDDEGRNANQAQTNRRRPNYPTRNRAAQQGQTDDE